MAPSTNKAPARYTGLEPYKAQTIAHALHSTQTDKAGRPYAEHLDGVADLVAALGGDKHDEVAAYFHDSVEDGHALWEQLAKFGVTTMSMATIDAVTKRPGEPNEVSLARVIAGGPRAQRLKLADLLHNTRHDRVAALRANPDLDADRTEARLRTYQHWIKVIMVELGLLPVEVGQ